ncbi:MAG TPA: GNAT family protein [Actinomycetota bacterium]|nr:GNAT family protein [Actinomycetota bacterium]
MTRVAGPRVTLRAYHDDEAPILMSTWADAPWFAPKGTSPRELAKRVRERIRRSGSFTDGVVIFAIESEGRLMGEVQARQPINGLPPGVFELGIEVFDHADRGKGVGADAIVSIARHLFDDEGAHRVQLTTDVENTAMRHVAERLGFAFEGVLRSFMPEPDGPHDYAMYAITENDYRERNATWT